MKNRNFVFAIVGVFVLFGATGFALGADWQSPQFGSKEPVTVGGVVQQKGTIGAPGTPDPKVTLSLYKESITNGIGLFTEGLLLLGNMETYGRFLASTKAMLGSGQYARSPLYLFSGTGASQTNIKLANFLGIGKERLGVWSEKDNNWADTRVKNTYASHLVLTDPATGADPYRTTSYTTSLGSTTNFDVAGKTNIGRGMICYVRNTDECPRGFFMNAIGSYYNRCTSFANWKNSEYYYNTQYNGISTGWNHCPSGSYFYPTYDDVLGYTFLQNNSGHFLRSAPQTLGSTCASTNGILSAPASSNSDNSHFAKAQGFGLGTIIYGDKFLMESVEPAAYRVFINASGTSGYPGGSQYLIKVDTNGQIYEKSPC